ncbi:MAG TPA: hypothetical protein VIG62_10570 [Blastocatellia bacterium]|jgi:hypothetical protein
MGVLSLHNECPPVGVGSDARAISQGLIIGEEATSSMLKAMADCLNALAAMDDTVGNLMGIFGNAPAEASAPPQAFAGGSFGGPDPLESFSRSFEALGQTVERVNIAVQKYGELKSYARSALEAGRGQGFQATLKENAGADFNTLVNRRIELLRKLKVRVMVLQRLQPVGLDSLANFNFPDFFLLFMQPIRDVSVAVNELYAETVRGALASHQTLFQACRLMGEDVSGIVNAAAAQRNVASAAAD